MAYNVTVGQGGFGAFSSKVAGSNGRNSEFNNTITSQGGGGGGSTDFNNGNGNDGGFGGGGAYNGSNNGNGGASNSNSTNKGGKSGFSGNGNQRSGGGGAGANNPGMSGNGNTGGNGADGVDLAKSCTNCPGYSTILLNVDNNILNTAGISTVIAAGGGGVGSNPGQGNGGGKPSAGNGGSSIGGNGNRDAKGLDGKTNSGSGGGGGTTGGGSGSNGLVVIRVTYRILPVEFLSLTATHQSKTNSTLIDWSTAKEWENSHFEIERAVNSVKTWETIGRVEGNGYSDIPVEYSFTDTDLPIAGGNIFYRLKQVDLSGTFSYSSTRAIKIDGIESNQNWLAYPNPSFIGTDVRVELVNPEIYQDQIITLSLINIFGQTKSFSPSSPEEISSIVSGWLDSSASGLYILDISWGDRRQQLKLIRY